jgi:hypothetical protein
MTEHSPEVPVAGGRPDRPEAVVGWRVWRLDPTRAELRSSIRNHGWLPGVNEATCPGSALIEAGAVGHLPCARAPGPGCSCGLWALWDLGLLVARERSYDFLAGRLSRNRVVGLISGWGLVALHGSEGFRCERARVLALFSDWVWDKSVDSLLDRPGRWWLQAWRFTLSPWRSGFGRVQRPDLWTRDGRNASRRQVLSETAESYGVPLLTLQGALRLGVLAELGLPRERDQMLRARLLAGRATVV